MVYSWWVFGLLCFVSIVGIPWGRACFVIGQFIFFPFGKEAISREELSLTKDLGTSIFGTIGNIIWLVLFGLWLAIFHVVNALILATTIVGIPFAIQHLKLASIALFPIGKTIVSKEMAAEARRLNAEERIKRIRI